MGMEVRNEHVYIGGVSAEDLAQRFGTPLYVFDEDEVRRRYREILSAILYRPLTVYYACKANPNLDLLRALRSEGAHLDAGSPGDVRLALAAGFSPSEIVYTGYAVSEDELEHLGRLSVFMNVDSLSQLARYGSLRPRSSVGLRINPGVVAGFHPHVYAGARESKLGLGPEQLEEALKIASQHDLTVACLHAHIGSDIVDARPFVKALEVLIDLARRIGTIQAIDVGGGFGVAYGSQDPGFEWSTYLEKLSAALSELSEVLGRPIGLWMEPGSYVVATAGYLLAKVVDIKTRRLLDGSRLIFVGTDTSLNHLLPWAMYGTNHPILIADRADASPTTPAHICGNLLQPGDTLARDRPMPQLKEGDLLVFTNVGAYNSCRVSRFNERPLPAEVVVSAGRAKLSRRRESLDDLLRDYLS